MIQPDPGKVAHMPIIPALGRLRQKYQFYTSLGYLASSGQPAVSQEKESVYITEPNLLWDPLVVYIRLEYICLKTVVLKTQKQKPVVLVQEEAKAGG